jgi:hypothetical protein
VCLGAKILKKILVFWLLFSTCLFGFGCQKKIEFRTDTEPITMRFTLLNDIETCYWTAGDIGEDRWLPSIDYWLGGFIILSPEQFQEFKTSYRWQKASEISFALYNNITINPDITGFPNESFDWIVSNDFTNAMLPEGYGGRMYLDISHEIIFFCVLTF